MENIEGKKQTNNNFSKISEWAFVIAPLTAISYGVAFLYKVGYFMYFNLPTFFIDLTLNALISALMGILPIFFSFLLFLPKVIEDIKNMNSKIEEFGGMNKKKLIFQTILVLIGFMLYLLFLIAIIKYIGYGVLIWVAIAIFSVVFIFVVIRLYRRNRYFTIVTWTLIFLLISSFSIGLSDATTNREYVILEMDKTKYVIIETYKEYYIIAPVDIKKKKIAPNYKLVEMKDLEISIKKIGNLSIR
jgi:hypothetical protein